MSAATVPVQQATIRQYAKRLQLVTIGGQFATVAEQAIQEKQSHLSYLEVLLGMEVEERERAGCVHCFTSSTRRFFARPSSVELSATGFVWPNPFAESRAAAMLCLVNHETTACARFSDRAWFAMAVP
jgi:hypothetical protein